MINKKIRKLLNKYKYIFYENYLFLYTNQKVKLLKIYKYKVKILLNKKVQMYEYNNYYMYFRDLFIFKNKIFFIGRLPVPFEGGSFVYNFNLNNLINEFIIPNNFHEVRNNKRINSNFYKYLFKIIPYKLKINYFKNNFELEKNEHITNIYKIKEKYYIIEINDKFQRLYDKYFNKIKFKFTNRSIKSIKFLSNNKLLIFDNKCNYIVNIKNMKIKYKLNVNKKIYFFKETENYYGYFFNYSRRRIINECSFFHLFEKKSNNKIKLDYDYKIEDFKETQGYLKIICYTQNIFIFKIFFEKLRKFDKNTIINIFDTGFYYVVRFFNYNQYIKKNNKYYINQLYYIN